MNRAKFINKFVLWMLMIILVITTVMPVISFAESDVTEERDYYRPSLDTFIRRGQYSISSDKQTNMTNLTNDSYATVAYGTKSPNQIQMEAYSTKGYYRRDAFLKFSLTEDMKEQIASVDNLVTIELKNITLAKGSGLLFDGYILPHDKLSLITNNLTYYQAVENDISYEENMDKYTEASGGTAVGLTADNTVVEMDITSALREYISTNPDADEFAIMLCIRAGAHQIIDSKSIEKSTTDNSYNMIIVRNAEGITGTAGDNAQWKLLSDTLIIYGDGVMPDYDTSSNTPPWYAYKSSIRNVIIEDGITYLGTNTFVLHSNLKNAVMADTVTSVGKYLFNGCTALNRVRLSENLASIPEGVFNNTKSLKSITVPFSTQVTQHGFIRTAYDLVISIYSCSSAYTWASNGTDTETPEMSANIGGEEAQKKTRTYVVLPLTGTVNENITWSLLKNTLTLSGTGAMPNYDTSSNTSPWYSYRDTISNIIIDDGITHIGSNNFVLHTNLKTAVMADSVTTVGTYVFNGCTSLSSVKLSENLKTIPEGVFNRNASLKSITVPANTKVTQHGFIRTAYDLIISVYAGSDAYTWATGGSGNETPEMSGNIAGQEEQKKTRTYKVIDSKGTEVDYYIGGYCVSDSAETIGIYSKNARNDADKVIFASYDADGLTSVSVVDATLAAGINNISAGEIFEPGESDEIYVMLWDDMENDVPLAVPYIK